MYIFSAALGLLAACTGTIGDSTDRAGHGADAVGSASPGGTSGSTACGGAAQLGYQGMHRLNRAEYDNTVRDLLGDTSGPSANFPPDDGADSFTNNADSLTISPLLFEGYQAAAETLASTAVHGNARAGIFTCDPVTTGAAACASQIVSSFAGRAWRRPLTVDEVTELAHLVSVATMQGDTFARGVELAIEAILLSPHFLFRPELDPSPASDGVHDLTQYELASRLSYFLWSSMPDAELFGLAKNGTLGDPTVLASTTIRMLDDPRAGAIVHNFAREWLTSTFAMSTPAPDVFPAFDADLRSAMQTETSMFMASLLLGQGSLLDLIDANYTFVNDRLAQHYAMPGITGAAFRRVASDGSHRGGLLTQGTMLTMTSVATRTSPVRRGEWVLAELLCSPPPPPPPNVPALPPTMTSGTMRQRLAQHRQAAECASCHKLMDPIGLALEHYDGVGAWRDSDEGQPIDATGTLPEGTRFDGAAELAKAIKNDSAFPGCATEKLFSYALGRVPTDMDRCLLTELTQHVADKGLSSRELMTAIIANDAFRKRRGGQ